MAKHASAARRGGSGRHARPSSRRAATVTRAGMVVAVTATVSIGAPMAFGTSGEHSAEGGGGLTGLVGGSGGSAPQRSDLHATEATEQPAPTLTAPTLDSTVLMDQARDRTAADIPHNRAAEFTALRRTDRELDQARTVLLMSRESGSQAAVAVEARRVTALVARRRTILAALQATPVTLQPAAGTGVTGVALQPSAVPLAGGALIAAAIRDAPSRAARIAIEVAAAQLGKPYVYGGAGPDDFDCSGLTMYAYAAAGVFLPHSAAEQYGYGTHVPVADLEPGDLVFYDEGGYIGHVGIYVGDGQMIDAPYTGVDVRIDPLFPGLIGGTRL